MYSEDHPHHFEASSPEAGAVGGYVSELPPGVDLDRLRATLLYMDYHITYKYGPPFVPLWFPAPANFFNPNNYLTSQQQHFCTPPCTGHPPLGAVINYYFSPAMNQAQDYNTWPSTPGYVHPKSQPRPPVRGPNHYKGSMIQTETAVPKPKLPIWRAVQGMARNKVQDRMRVGNHPPDIYDETVFPSLTKKDEHLESEWTMASNMNVSPRTMRELKAVPEIQNSNPRKGKYNHNGREEQENKKVSDIGKDGAITNPIQREFQPKENSVSHPTAVVTDKMLPPTIAFQAPAHRGDPTVMNSRPSRVFTNMTPLFPLDCDLNHPQVYRHMLRYVPSRNRLKELGYPSESSRNPQETIILKTDYHSPANTKKGNKRDRRFHVKLCDRCGKSFDVKSGKNFYKEKCIYHWGKIQTTEDFKAQMTCCERSPTTFGCTMAKSHVWNGLYFGLNTNLKGFVSTGYSNPSPGASPQVFGLDCEMCFTTVGLELVKVALVDLAGDQVYYSLVFPENEVVDYNTRFSGVSEKDFSVFKAKSFRTVQGEVLKLIKSDTIIIGHGLENDLRALKIVHQLVVDTSIVYPHEHGFPFRRPLKDIAAEVLNKKIQENGHNPLEDANVCVELVLKKLKKDFNIRITTKQK